jgi:DNA polymerase-4
MPLRTAARRCPDAVFLPTDAPAYEAASEQVMAVLRGFGLVLEVLGWDEAFLGAGTDDPEALARDLQRAVRDATRLACSVGVGDNTLRAKLATGLAKPAGVFRLTAENWFAVLGPEPTTALWGIGSRTARRLADLGIHTVAGLAAADPRHLAEHLGPTNGPWYVQLGRGIGRTEVLGAPYVPRSRSRETTFDRNLTGWDDVRAEVAALARRVAADVAAEGRPAVRVGVKVRFAPFTTRTRSVPLDAPTTDPARIEAAAAAVLETFARDRPIRLLGVRAEFDRE